MTPGSKDVWPPPPANREDGTPGPGAQGRPVRLALGVASLILSLPGACITTFDFVVWHVIHWSPLRETPYELEPLVGWLVYVAPLLGLVCGLLGQRSLPGKLGVLSSIVNYATFLFLFIMDFDR